MHLSIPLSTGKSSNSRKSTDVK